MTGSSFDQSLLPPGGTAPRCAEYSASLGVDPAGSALFVAEVLMIDVALPWPKPVWAADGYTHVPEAVMAAADAGRRVRALAAVPLDDEVARIVGYERVPGIGPMVRHEWHLDPGEVGTVADRLLREGMGAAEDHRVEVPPGRREVAICTQGSHDLCCGASGTRLVADLRAARPGLSVRKVSHTGGHRYAPTGLTFPDGRMWGFVSAEELGAILDREGSPAAIVGRCRGWTGASPVAQVAERAVFAAIDDWSVDDVERTVSVTEHEDGWVCEVGVAGRSWAVTVAPGRAVPTITCRADGGLPAKPGTEYRVVSVRER